MAYDPNNVFAKILRGEMKAEVVLEDEHCLAFMDAMPQSPGHTLVVPRQPAEDIFALDESSLSHLVLATRRVARAVKAAFQVGGVMVLQLNGVDAGQTVFHIHFHVIPRRAGEELTQHSRSVAAPGELAAHAAKIRAALDG